MSNGAPVALPRLGQTLLSFGVFVSQDAWLKILPVCGGTRCVSGGSWMYGRWTVYTAAVLV